MGKAQVSFHTASEANIFIERVHFLLGEARVSVVHGETNTLKGLQRKNMSNKPQPPVSVIKGLPSGMCRFRFVLLHDDENQLYFEYKV